MVVRNPRPCLSVRRPTPARPHRRTRRRLPGQYNPRIASDGLCVDTWLGPVDLVAVRRAQDGKPVTLTRAERHYLYQHTAPQVEHAEPVGQALGMLTESVKTQCLRHQGRTRSHGKGLGR